MKASTKPQRRRFATDNKRRKIMRGALVLVCGRVDVTAQEIDREVASLYNHWPADLLPRIPRRMRKAWARIGGAK